MNSFPPEMKTGDLITDPETEQQAKVLWHGSYLENYMLTVLMPMEQAAPTQYTQVGAVLLPESMTEETEVSDDDLVAITIDIDVGIPTPIAVDIVLNMVTSQFYKQKAEVLIKRAKDTASYIDNSNGTKH